MPFDPDELANGMMKWLEHGRKPKQAPADPNPYDPDVIYQNPEPSPPPAEMPGSGPNVAELQEQIKALQEQLKTLQGDGGAQLIPRGPGRDAPVLTPEERLEKDLDAFNRWRQGSGGEPRYAGPRRPGPVPMPNPYGYRPDIPHHDDGIADMPSWGPYKNAPQEKPRWENLPYYYKQEEKPNWENLPYKRPENPNDNPNIQLLKGLNK